MDVRIKLLDWDTNEVLAEETHPSDAHNFPATLDWKRLFEKVQPKPGFQWHLMLDSCDTPEDKPKIDGDAYAYTGYAKAVNLDEYWTEHDDSGRHIDGIRIGTGTNGIPIGWKIYDPESNRNRERAQECVAALVSSPFYYYMLDTGNCQKPTAEKVYRISVNPEDNTILKIEFWGNLASTRNRIWSRFLIMDSTDKEHVAELTIQNGDIQVNLFETN